THLHGGEDDVCDVHCTLRGQGRHHHYQLNVASGFLGLLEALATIDEATGIRTYDFFRTPHDTGSTLRALGSSGRVVQAFVPAKLGCPRLCSQLTHRQHDLVQVMVREITRA